jgi:hypothetical protein
MGKTVPAFRMALRELCEAGSETFCDVMSMYRNNSMALVISV